IETAVLYVAEARARASLHNTIDQLPEAVVVVDERGMVTAMNRAAVALVPIATKIEDWGDPAIVDLRDLDGEHVGVDELPIVRALRSGEVTLEREFVMRSPDGRCASIVVSAGPVRDDEQRIAGAVAVIADVSERREEQRLRDEWNAVIAHDLRQP